MINFKVEIYNHKDKTYETKPSAVFTPKFANLLDEQLDEATITLKGDLTAYYQPLTRVRIIITNNPECKLTQAQARNIADNKELSAIAHNYSNNLLTESLVLEMFIANDRGIETPVGSGRYNHEIYLIERTKLLERYICDSLTFTNPLGNNYLGQNEGNNATYSTFKTELYNPDGLVIDYGDKVTSYRTPTSMNQAFTIINPLTFFQNDAELPGITNNDFALSGGVYITDSQDREIYKQYISDEHLYEVYNGSIISDVEYDIFSGVIPWKNGNITFPKTGMFNIKYTTGDPSANYISQGAIAVVYNRLPLKKWTITDVINRVFEIVEPLEVIDGVTEKPRFRLNQAQAIKFDKILSPEFTFTQQTLREILQQIGGYIHGEPRITSEIIENGKSYFVVAYDMYGSNEYSKISNQSYITATFGTDVNQYCTALDSNAQNLTNTLDWAQGVILEPFDFAYKSLRTENTTTRLQEDNNTVISTQFPVGRIQSVICKYIPDVGQGEWDITPYVFESTAYSNELSNYQGSYPFSKAYGLYYTMGQKNIKGLFFKADHAASPVFHNYAIVNILRAVTGNNSLKIEGQDLMRLSFSVSYVPLYSARVKTYKQLIQDGFSSTLVYNQGANAIETRYYGEHLKGAVERLGNVEKTYTYKLAFLSQIPKVGTRFDKHYYISNVSYELFPTYIKCTVGLSKNFNRKSQYVGINSQKRMWEISERQAQERQTVYPIYVVASETEQANDSNIIEVLDHPASILFNSSIQGLTTSVDLAVVRTYDINGNPSTGENTWLYLPVIASAFGNSMTFTYNFEDNYSAGQKIIEVDGDGAVDDDVTGFWGANVPYTDYYGRFYYIESSLFHINNLTASKRQDASLTLPQVIADGFPSYNFFINRRYVYRKDNREIPQITHEVAVVTDNENIIIGSALCRNCRAVNKTPKKYSLYIFSENLNVIESKVDLSKAIETTSAEITVTSDSIIVSATATTSAKSWAIITNPTEKVIEVEAEDGTQTTQPIYEGGEILIGQNNFDLTKASKTIHFATKRKINE